MSSFYDKLSPFYHLIYPDWEASIELQAQQIDQIIAKHWGDQSRQLLDVSCGIGTQSLGLAAIGYEINASCPTRS